MLKLLRINIIQCQERGGVEMASPTFRCVDVWRGSTCECARCVNLRMSAYANQCACEGVRECVHACVHACIRPCMHAFVRACMHVCVAIKQHIIDWGRWYSQQPCTQNPRFGWTR